MLLFACLICLHASFLWARIAFFRIEGNTPLGVRLIEAAGTASVLMGAVLTLNRDGQNLGADLSALGVAALSAALFAWALRSVQRRQLTAAFSVDTPRELVTSGAFKRIRNPFYTSYLLAHAMPVLASRSAWSLLPLAWMGCIYLYAAWLEEQKFLASPLADDFRRYRGRAGRFAPRLLGAKEADRHERQTLPACDRATGPTHVD